MSDLTMCSKPTCQKRHECYRYLAPPNPLYQAYGIPDTCISDNKDFWPIDGRRVRDVTDVDIELAEQSTEEIA